MNVSILQMLAYKGGEISWDCTGRKEKGHQQTTNQKLHETRKQPSEQQASVRAATLF